MKANKVINCLLQLAAINNTHNKHYDAKDNFEAIMSIYQRIKMNEPGTYGQDTLL